MLRLRYLIVSCVIHLFFLFVFLFLIRSITIAIGGGSKVVVAISLEEGSDKGGGGGSSSSAKPKLKSTTKPKAKLKANPKRKSSLDFRAHPKPKFKPKLKPKPKPKPKPISKFKPKPKPKPKSKLISKQIQKPKPQNPQPKPEPESESKSNPQTKTNFQPKPTTPPAGATNIKAQSATSGSLGTIDEKVKNGEKGDGLNKKSKGGKAKGNGIKGGIPGRGAKFLKLNYKIIYDILQRNLTYPFIARKMGWEGRVVISFVLTPLGKVEDIKILKSSGYEILDENTVKVLRSCAKLFPIPPVRVRITIPVVYRLE